MATLTQVRLRFPSRNKKSWLIVLPYIDGLLICVSCIVKVDEMILVLIVSTPSATPATNTPTQSAMGIVNDFILSDFIRCS